MTSDGTNTYSWDERNRLIGISGAVTASFKYDSFGRRITKTISGVQTNFLYDGVSAVETVSGSTTVSLLRGLGVDELYASLSATQQLNLLTDSSGSTIALTDATQAVKSSYGYDAYGNGTLTGTLSSSEQYTGRENDGTGLYYYRARYYSARYGRFISSDPIGWNGGQTNGYAYVGGNPVSRRDELGLDWQASVGVSGTLFGLTVGGGGGGSVGISTDGTLGGTYLTATGQVNVMGGLGAFAGVGVNYGVGHSDGPPTSGTSQGVYGEVDLGGGEAVSLSGQIDTDGNIGGAGAGPIRITPGVGYGAAAGLGAFQSTTAVSPSVADMIQAIKNMLNPPAPCN